MRLCSVRISSLLFLCVRRAPLYHTIFCRTLVALPADPTRTGENGARLDLH